MMIKLLIVDDEQIERDGMEAIIKKGFPDTKIMQAKNGKMAIELAETFQPDLILMDIKMPGINGLEAMERITASNSMIRFIMVTAFDTFEYMRQAIKLGVKDYILKPSRASEIITTVGKVFQQIKEEHRATIVRKYQEEAFLKALSLVETDVVTQLLFDHVHEVHVDMLVEMLETPSTQEMFVMLALMPTEGESLYSIIKETIRETKSCWVGALYGSHLPIIVFRDEKVSYRSQATALAHQVLSIVKRTKKAECFIGIGNVSDSLEKVRQSYHEALFATMDSSLPAKYRFYSEEAASSSEAMSGRLIEHRKKEFADQIRMGQWENVRKYILYVLQHYEREAADILHTQQRILEILWIISRVMEEMGMETDPPLYAYKPLNYRELQVETTRLLDKMVHSFRQRTDRLEADAIHQLKQYILSHSQEDISLDSLARKVGLSPIYISKIFKEKQGVNYIDFLTECRIEKAKELIRDTDKSIKEITFEVGYHDPNYFSKVFKKLCNLSPKEYRKLLLANKTS